KITLDAKKIDGIAVHRLNVEKDLDTDGRRLFGKNPFYVAVRPDALLVAGGEGGLDALKGALQLEAKQAPPLRVEVSVANLAPAIAHGTDATRADLAKVIADAFGDGKGGDTIRFSIEGGDSLTARFSVPAPAIKFLRQVSQNPKAYGL